MIFFDVKEQQITSKGTLSACFCSSGSQKKVNSDSAFGSGDVIEAVILDREVILYVFSASGFQKKERSETGFVHGVTGDEMSFVGGVI